MRTTLASYVDDFLSRENKTAFAHRHGLRVKRWSYSQIARTAFRFARELEARRIAKGVLITHRNLMANLTPLEREIKRHLKWERLFHPIRFLNLLPLSHVFGQFMGIFVPQLLAGEVFFQESLSPLQIVETVKRERIS